MMRCLAVGIIILFICFSTGVTDQFTSCNGELDTIQDGKCDINNNVIECGYDGGDCCECSCNNDRIYPCGIWGFNCSDPDVNDYAGGCLNEAPMVRPCSSDATVTWLVNDTASAMSLAEAVNCSGGTFNVTWRGRVLVNRTLYIRNNTTLYVTGEDSGAEINGDRKTRLFTIENAFLYINGLTLTNGSATYGGAIAATRSSIVLNQTWSRGNFALSYGGAIYVGMTSTLTFDGASVLTDNQAGRGGGAIAVSVKSNASWSGPSRFSSNTAVVDGGFGGAVYVNDNCRVSWGGVTSFENNTAYKAGGGVFVFSISSARWDQETSFVNNTAYQGGALYVSSSFASWEGVTSFFGNNAGLTGGALFVNDSQVSWDGLTSFFQSTAEYGGALDITYSRVSWNGETYFVNNTAQYGGALRVEPYCVIVWYGVTSFVGNTAKFNGALYVGWNSIVSCNGETSFVNNSADNGGALSVHYQSFVSCGGKTIFTDNKATSNGGGVYVTASSTFSVTGSLHFLGNRADEDGGAAYVIDSDGDGISSNFTVDNNSTVLFQDNTCGGNGGATGLVGGVALRFPPDVTFRGNTAGVGGGAMYISGVLVGIHLKKAKFISNSALIGGGLYSTGSGTAVTLDGKEHPQHHPTVLIGCEFIENKAVNTGGAIDSSAGRDTISNTSFVSNTASIGGGLRLVGTTSLIGCDFVNNLSGDNEGPGVSNDGVITNLSGCSFIDNVFNCQMGSFLDYDDMGARFDTVCKGCEAQCIGCSVDGKEPVCLEEMKHSTSAGKNTTLESLLIEHGYWRATNRSRVILACYNSKACLGGVTGEKGFCVEGYEGPYCSVCSDGYTASLGFSCNKCTYDHAGGIALTVLTAFVFLFVIVAFVSYMLSGEMEGADKGIVVRVTRFIPLQSVKIVIVVWQILTQFSSVANVVFPSVYQRFLDSVDVINFDLSWIFSFGCIIDTDFHDQLLLVTLGPLVCIVILGVTFAVAMAKNRDVEEARGIIRRKHVSMVLLLTFLIYSSVSSTLFKTFDCDTQDDGKTYLRADYRIECDSSKHTVLQIYAGLMVFLYVVGIPAFYGVLLYNNREALMNNEEQEEDGSIRFITDLWKPYRSQLFYYEVIECARRVLLTGALVFIYPNTAAQIAAALMMATFFIFVSEALAPYASLWDTWCSRTGHAIVFTSMFLALLLKVDVSGERASSQRVFEWVLVCAQSCLILVVVIEAVAMIVAWREQVEEDSEPRIRSGLSNLSPGHRHDCR